MAVSETNTKPLLDWLLRKHPETPKSRAKQWIAAGRVSVNGEVIRKPHQTLPDPGEALQLMGGMPAPWRAVPDGTSIRAFPYCTWIRLLPWSTRAPGYSPCRRRTTTFRP